MYRSHIIRDLFLFLDVRVFSYRCYATKIPVHYITGDQIFENCAVADSRFPKGNQPTIWPIIYENYMKMKNFWQGA